QKHGNRLLIAEVGSVRRVRVGHEYQGTTQNSEVRSQNAKLKTLRIRLQAKGFRQQDVDVPSPTAKGRHLNHDTLLPSDLFFLPSDLRCCSQNYKELYGRTYL